MSKEITEIPTVDSTSNLAAEKGEMTDSMTDLENNADLLAKVSSGLEKTFGERVDDAPAQDTKPVPPKQKTIPVKQTVEPERTVEAAQETTQEVTEIPHNYIRAAVRQGWKEEDIQALADNNPDLALQTMQNIYESSKKISDQFSQLGRTQIEIQQRQQQEQQAQYSRQQEQRLEQQSSEPKQFVNFKKLEEQYGNDPLIENVIKPLNDALVELSGKVNQGTTKPTPDTQATELPAELVTELDAFFGDENLKNTYGDFYGTSNDREALTLGQNKNRWAVIEKADQIIAGASLQGIPMSIGEALENAHILISEPVKTAAIRKEIKSKVVTRSKGISLRPSSPTNTQQEGQKPRTPEELEQTVAARLRNLNW